MLLDMGKVIWFCVFKIDVNCGESDFAAVSFAGIELRFNCVDGNPFDGCCTNCNPVLETAELCCTDEDVDVLVFGIQFGSMVFGTIASLLELISFDGTSLFKMGIDGFGISIGFCKLESILFEVDGLVVAIVIVCSGVVVADISAFDVDVARIDFCEICAFVCFRVLPMIFGLTVAAVLTLLPTIGFVVFNLRCVICDAGTLDDIFTSVADGMVIDGVFGLSISTFVMGSSGFGFKFMNCLTSFCGI